MANPEWAENTHPTTPPPRRIFSRGFLRLVREPGNLRRAAGVVAVYAKIARCFTNSAFLMLRP